MKLGDRVKINRLVDGVSQGGLAAIVSRSGSNSWQVELLKPWADYKEGSLLYFHEEDLTPVGAGWVEGLEGAEKALAESLVGHLSRYAPGTVSKAEGLFRMIADRFYLVDKEDLPESAELELVGVSYGESEDFEVLATEDGLSTGAEEIKALVSAWLKARQIMLEAKQKEEQQEAAERRDSIAELVFGAKYVDIDWERQAAVDSLLKMRD